MLPDPRVLGLVDVRGASMQPALAEGDVLLVLRGALARVGLRPGAVVVVRHAVAGRGGRRQTAARSAPSTPGGRVGWDVRGDAPAAVSTDSRQHGPVPPSAVGARVLLRVGPPPPRRPATALRPRQLID